MVRIVVSESEESDSDIPDAWSMPPFTQVPIEDPLIASHRAVKRKAYDDSAVSGTEDEDEDEPEEIFEAEWPMEIIDDMMEPTEDSIMDCGNDSDALHVNPIPVIAKPEKVVRQHSVVKQVKTTRTTSLVSHQI
jgi:hypothetical protein